MTTDKTIFSVSQLNRRAKQLLETHLPLIWVSGELSNLAKPSSGHWYFTLKDNQAQVRCAMFRASNQRLKWRPESGDQVLLRARVSLYEGRGEYQLIAEHMEAAGTGLLQQQYEVLKAKLSAEGLFDDARKQALPAFPKNIGVITSPSGAAIHDIISVLKRRYPIAPVILFPVSVQGEKAANEMIAALDKAINFRPYDVNPLDSKQCDVLIIGRGGGSIEDLWAFNNEALARAIAACPIPVVSAVGHEVDFTIADFVADQRAPTPSVSAEIIAPDLNEWLQTLDTYQQSLQDHCQRKIQQQQQKLQFLQRRLRHPGERIRSQQKQLSYLKQTLIHGINTQLAKQNNLLTQTQLRFGQHHPEESIQRYTDGLSTLKLRLSKAINNLISNKQQYFSHQIGILNAISPLSVLSRGYSITNNKDGSIVKNSHEVHIGDEINTRLADGYITSIVKNTF
jgi:exodeoxyribonuclease VII large subunit